MKALQKGEYSGSILRINAGNGLLASITTYDPDTFNYTLHYHDNAHFGFTIEGGGIEKKKDVYEIEAGQMVCYYAGEPHQALRIFKPSLRINLELENSFFIKYRLTEEMVLTAAKKNPEAKFLMIKIYRELLTNDAHTNTATQMLLLQLVHYTNRVENNRNIPLWIKTINELIHENLNNKITLHDLSIATNVHPVTVSKHFPKYFNCTLGEYIRKLKIEKSLTLIKCHKLSLSALANECGFFDQSHFIKNFKMQTGFLPASYRMIGIKRNRS